MDLATVFSNSRLKMPFEPLRGLFGNILGPILDPFWDHFWVQFGFKKQPQNKSKFKTLSDTILGPVLESFWDQNWTDFDVIWELC